MLEQEKTLLKNFILEKLRSFQEPTRKGTPKGDPIGFSKAKYQAALLCLTCAPLQDIAKHLNVSYGLLRKWRTEIEFTVTIAQLAREFADLFYKTLVDIGDKDEAVATTLDKLECFSDANEYGKLVQKAIDKKMDEYLIRLEYVTLFSYVFSKYSPLLDRDDIKALKRNAAKVVISQTISQLSENLLLEEDRKEIIAKLSLVKEWLEEA